MERSELMKSLTEMGYDVDEIDVTKNGVVKKGIRVDGYGYACPVIYADNYDSAKEAADAIERAFKEDVQKTLPLDVQYVMTTPGAMAERVLIGLQKSSTENICKAETPFDGIEQYLYVTFNEDNTMLAKLTLENVATCKGIDEGELWARARRNTFAKTKVMTLGEVLKLPIPDSIYVVTNEWGFRGASAILDTQTLKEEGLIGEFVMLPSSIHEVLLVPDDGVFDDGLMSEMVQSINAAEVEPEEWLGDKAYHINI